MSERYRLEGVHCSTCKANYFPKRNVCPTCRRKGKLEPLTFKGKGKVYSFTEISSGPTGFADQTPYVLAIVELEEGPKITAQMVDARISEMKIGMPVETVFRIVQKDDPEGLIHYGYKFRQLK